MAAKKKKVVAKKKAAPKKSAPKKKVSAKKAVKKPAPKKKVVAKKKAPAPKKKPAAPSAPKKAPTPPPPSPPEPETEVAAEAPAADNPLPEVSLEFHPEVAAFCELVNSGGAGEADLEGYESFNEQYKPSDWARNPALDQQMLTFAMDGAGGQFTLWRQPGRELLDNPVVQLGDDGELHVLAKDFASFVALVAEGVDLFSKSLEDLDERPQLKDFVKKQYGERDFGDAGDILQNAKTAWANFEEWMRSQVKS